jgi:hypothetical protein
MKKFEVPFPLQRRTKKKTHVNEAEERPGWEGLSASDYSRALSFMYIARFTDLCMTRCQINNFSPIPKWTREELSHHDQACLSQCIEEIKPVHKIVYSNYLEGVQGLFDTQ